MEPVAVDFSKAGLALCILDSCADHADLTDEYAAVPAECRAVAAVCGGEVLRDTIIISGVRHLDWMQGQQRVRECCMICFCTTGIPMQSGQGIIFMG